MDIKRKNVGKRTVERDLTLALVATILVVFIVIGTLSYQLILNQTEQTLTIQTTQLADNLAQVLSRPLWNVNNTTITQIAQSYEQSESLVGLTIYDDGGTAVYTNSKPADGSATFVLERDITYEGRPVGHAELVFSTITLDALSQGIIILLFLVSIPVLLTIFFGTQLLVRRFVSRPLHKLSEGIDIIADGNYQHRLQKVPQIDINFVAESANIMAEQIDYRDQNLRSLVTERTQDLELAAEIGQNVSQIRDLNDLATTAVSLIRQRFNLYHTQLYLVDKEQNKLVLFSGTGEAGKRMMAANHSLPIDTTSLNGQAVIEKQAVIVADTVTNHDFKPHPLLPDTRSETAVPLMVGHDVVGVLDLQSDQANTFTTENLTAFVVLAGQIAIAVENSKLFAEQKRIEAELQAAQNHTQEILESITVPLVISKIADGTVAYVNQPLAETIGVPRDELLGQVTPDFYEDPADRQAYLKALREQGYVSNYDLRLKRGDGEPFWALISGRIINFEGTPAIINSVIDINERRKAQTLVAQRATEMATVAEVGTVAATILEPDQLLQQVVDLTKERFGLYHAHIYLVDAAEDQLMLSSGAGTAGAAMVAAGHTISYHHENSIVAQAARTKQSIIVNDVTVSASFLPNPLLPDTKSEMAVPMMVGSKVIGILDIQADTVDYFTETDIPIQTTLATQIAVALENAHAFEQANEQARIIQSTPNMIATATLDGKIRFMNEAGLQRLGYDSLDEVRGKILTIFYPPDIDMSRRKEIGAAIQQHGIWQGENRVITKSGEVFPVEQIITLIRDEQGTPKLSAINMTDITERKQAEERIRRNEALLRTIIDSTPDWIFVKDSQHRYQIVNKAYAETTNFEPDELIGKTILDIGLPEEIAETLLAEDIALMESGEPIVVAEEELLLDGKTRYQTLTKVILRNEFGQVQNMVGYAHDVTNQVLAAAEQKQLQQELEAQLERVNALQRAMTRESWQAFMTATAAKRPFQGFAFNQEGIKTLTSQDLTNGKNKEAASAANGDNELITPVKIQDTTIGKLGVRNPDGTPISAEKRSLLISLTTQVAEALDRARLFEETELGRQEIEAQAAELSIVNEISELASTQLRINDLVNAVGDRLIETFSANSAYIALVDEKTRVINFPYFTTILDGPLNLPPRTLDDKGGFTARIYTTKQPVINNPVAQDIATAVVAGGGEVVDSSQDSDSYIGVPMMVGETVIGVIGLNGQQNRRKYDEEDLPLLTTLARTIAVAVQNAQQFEATQQRANREALVNEISQKIQNTQTVETALEIAANELGQIFQSPYVAVEINLANQQKPLSNKE